MFIKPGMVAHNYDPSYSRSRGKGLKVMPAWVKVSEILSQKNHKKKPATVMHAYGSGYFERQE
jgi:hypothetical protein